MNNVFAVFYKYKDSKEFFYHYVHEGLCDCFNEVFQELFPECHVETHVQDETLFIYYKNEQDDDDEGEFTLPFTTEAIQEYINDFIENNETDFSEIIIKQDKEYSVRFFAKDEETECWNDVSVFEIGIVNAFKYSLGLLFENVNVEVVPATGLLSVEYSNNGKQELLINYSIESLNGYLQGINSQHDSKFHSIQIVDLEEEAKKEADKPAYELYQGDDSIPFKREKL